MRRDQLFINRYQIIFKTRSNFHRPTRIHKPKTKEKHKKTLTDFIKEYNGEKEYE